MGLRITDLSILIALDTQVMLIPVTLETAYGITSKTRQVL